MEALLVVAAVIGAIVEEGFAAVLIGPVELDSVGRCVAIGDVVDIVEIDGEISGGGEGLAGGAFGPIDEGGF